VTNTKVWCGYRQDRCAAVRYESLNVKITFKILNNRQFIFQIAPSHKAKRHETHVPIIHNQFCWGNLRERDNLEDLSVDWRTKLNIGMDLQKGRWYSIDWINLVH